MYVGIGSSVSKTISKHASLYFIFFITTCASLSSSLRKRIFNKCCDSTDTDTDTDTARGGGESTQELRGRSRNFHAWDACVHHNLTLLLQVLELELQKFII